MRRDPVTPEVRIAVFERDHGCIAMTIDYFSDPCNGRLTLDHIRDHAGMGARRAPSDMAHLVTVCWHHHLESGWSTSHRAEIREYLKRVNPPEVA